MRYVIYTLLLLVAVSVNAASFDCSLAQSNTEKMICANGDLSKADDELSILYNNIKDQSRYPDDLAKDQLSWLKERNACKTDVCVLAQYKSRVVALNDWPNKEAIKAKALENCTDRPECWPEGSSMRTGLLLVENLNKATLTLKDKHEALVNIVSASGDPQGSDARMIAALKSQEAAWLQYRVTECELVGSLTGAGGTWPSTYANKCEVNLTEERIRKVDSAFNCIEKLPQGERQSKMNECLQQLAPLGTKH